MQFVTLTLVSSLVSCLPQSYGESSYAPTPAYGAAPPPSVESLPQSQPQEEDCEEPAPPPVDDCDEQPQEQLLPQVQPPPEQPQFIPTPTNSDQVAPCTEEQPAPISTALPQIVPTPVDVAPAITTPDAVPSYLPVLPITTDVAPAESTPCTAEQPISTALPQIETTPSIQSSTVDVAPAITTTDAIAGYETPSVEVATETSLPSIETPSTIISGAVGGSQASMIMIIAGFALLF